MYTRVLLHAWRSLVFRSFLLQNDGSNQGFLKKIIIMRSGDVRFRHVETWFRIWVNHLFLHQLLHLFLHLLPSTIYSYMKSVTRSSLNWSCCHLEKGKWWLRKTVLVCDHNHKFCFWNNLYMNACLTSTFLSFWHYFLFPGLFFTSNDIFGFFPANTHVASAFDCLYLS